MSEVSEDKQLFGGRSAKFWTIASVGVVLAFAGILACGLLMGAGALATMRFLTTERTVSAKMITEDMDTIGSGAASEAEASEEAAAFSDDGDALPEKPILPPRIGNPASDFTLKDLEGNTVSLSDFAGRPVIINFWATWCGPCEAEMPAINAAYLDHRDEGLVVLAVDLEEHPDTVQSFVDYYKLDFIILLDRDTKVAKQYNARALPTTYFIDPAGVIVHTYFGGMREKDLAIGLKKILP